MVANLCMWFDDHTGIDNAALTYLDRSAIVALGWTSVANAHPQRGHKSNQVPLRLLIADRHGDKQMDAGQELVEYAQIAEYRDTVDFDAPDRGIVTDIDQSPDVDVADAVPVFSADWPAIRRR